MDKPKAYLRRRGWRQRFDVDCDRDLFNWVDPNDKRQRYSTAGAVSLQTERDAEQLDIVTAQLAGMTARVAELEGTIESVKSYLKDITRIAGNLPDETVEAIGGVNDGKSRALMVVYARKFARQALKTLEGALGGQPNANTK